MATHFELKIWELVCYSFIFIVGLLGNLVVILVVMTSGPAFRRFRTVPFNVYLMSLAVADLILAVVCLPIYVMSTGAFPHPSGTKGDIFCKIITGYAIPFWLAGVSIYMLVIISFERYNALAKPFQAATRTTSKTTFLFITAAWLVGFIRQIPTFIGVRFSGSNATYGNKCAYVWEDTASSAIIYACVVTIQYVIPAVIFVVNFYRTQKCLTRLDRMLKRSLGDAHQRTKLIKSKKKTVRVVLVACIAFFVCWTPDNVTYFMFQYGGVKEIVWNSDGYQVAIVLGFFNSCINPFLYAFQSRDFRLHCRKALGKMFGIRYFPARQPGSSMFTTSMSSSTIRSNVKFRVLPTFAET